MDLKYIFTVMLLLGGYLYNHGIDLTVEHEGDFFSPLPVLEYAVCNGVGVLMITVSLSYFCWKTGLLSLVDSGIFSFMLIMMPMFMMLGLNVFWWFLFILMPSFSVLLFLKIRKKN